MAKSETAKKLTELLNSADKLASNFSKDIKKLVEAAKQLREMSKDKD